MNSRLLLQLRAVDMSSSTDQLQKMKGLKVL